MIKFELRLENTSPALETLRSVTFASATLGNGADNPEANPGKGIKHLETSVCIVEEIRT